MSTTIRDEDLFIEFREDAVHVLDGEKGLEIPLARTAEGRIAPESAERAIQQLRAFFLAHGHTEPRIACCSIPARGVSLRRVSVPQAARAESRGLLALQLEAQLPISPTELAWGARPVSKIRNNGSAPGLEEFLVVAVKREILSDYTRILADAGLAAQYTVAALARREVITDAPERFGVLDVGVHRSELAAFDAQGAASLRVLPWGASNPGEIDAARNGHKLFLTQPFPNGAPGDTELLKGLHGAGRTAANLGLRAALRKGAEPIFLGGDGPNVPEARRAHRWRWLALAGMLAVLALALRYAEAAVYQSRLTRKLAAIAQYRSTLPNIEREYNFLHFIKTNQPPCLDTLAALATAAPPGTKIEHLSIVRQGDIALRGSVGDAQAPGVFRSKLIDSGLFSRVVLDEQAPTADGQKFTFRLSAQLKPDGSRKTLELGANTNELKKAGR